LEEILALGDSNWRSKYVVSKIPVPQSKYILVAVFPWSIGQGDIAGAGHAFLLLFVFVSLITIAVGSFSALEIAQPVKEIVYRAERIAKGDLSEPLEILSEDEVGEFSADLEQIRRFLRSVLSDVDVASHQVEGLSSMVLAAAQSVARSSVDQSSRVNAGRQAIERMALGFDRISKGSLELTTQAGEGGSAIYQLDATVREVDGSTELMVGKVVNIREGIDKIHRVSELIFGNLGDLSRSMESTVRNIRKFSDSIRRNEERVGTARAVSTRMLESSREGLQLTGQTLGSIEAIEQSVTGISNTLNELIEKLNDVGKLIGVIDEVADDTKLLSLNAAIIAAQAGANGRGFSVLAEKIKTLADRTNIATGQIITMIEQVGDSSHQLAYGMERVRNSVHTTRLVASESGDRLGGIITCAQSGFEGMAVVASTSGKHVDESQLVERAVVGLANSVEQIHSNVRGQRARAVEVGTAMERVEAGVRTLKSASRAQSEGGRVLSASIEQVVTMVTHLKKILLEQQAEVHRINEAIRAIQEGAAANQMVSKNLTSEVEALRGEAETFNRFMDRFKLS
jgi:methyl-accepting chemotaxis protein